MKKRTMKPMPRSYLTKTKKVKHSRLGSPKQSGKKGKGY
jgi:hypothetical protein